MFLRVMAVLLGLVGLCGIGIALIASQSPRRCNRSSPRRRRRRFRGAYPGRRARPARRQPVVMEDITAADVDAARPLPGTYPDSITARTGLRGAMIRRSLTPNEPIVAGDVLAPGDRGFLAAVLGTGMRAVTVGVDSVSGTAGLIWPGDRVDLLLTQSMDDKDQPRDRRISGETVMTNLRVIAVDQQLVQGGQGNQTNPGPRQRQPHRHPRSQLLRRRPHRHRLPSRPACFGGALGGRRPAAAGGGGRCRHRAPAARAAGAADRLERRCLARLARPRAARQPPLSASTTGPRTSRRSSSDGDDLPRTDDRHRPGTRPRPSTGRRSTRPRGRSTAGTRPGIRAASIWAASIWAASIRAAGFACAAPLAPPAAAATVPPAAARSGGPSGAGITPGAPVRTGDHPGYGRVVFDLPPGASWTLDRDGDRLTVRFSGADPLAGAKPPRNVRALNVAAGAAELSLAPGVQVRPARLGNRLLLDVLDPVAAAAAGPVAATAAPERVAATAAPSRRRRPGSTSAPTPATVRRRRRANRGAARLRHARHAAPPPLRQPRRPRPGRLCRQHPLPCSRTPNSVAAAPPLPHRIRRRSRRRPGRHRHPAAFGAVHHRHHARRWRSRRSARLRHSIRRARPGPHRRRAPLRRDRSRHRPRVPHPRHHRQPVRRRSESRRGPAGQPQHESSSSASAPGAPPSPPSTRPATRWRIMTSWSGHPHIPPPRLPPRCSVRCRVPTCSSPPPPTGCGRRAGRHPGRRRAGGGNRAQLCRRQRRPWTTATTIPSSVQVTLRVRIAEISRTITRQLGINWTALANFGNWSAAAAIIDGLGSGANPPNTIGAGFNDGTSSINTVLDLLAQDQLITMLAEPNLTARSGETASFLAGGEFPIPIAGSGNGRRQHDHGGVQAVRHLAGLRADGAVGRPHQPARAPGSQRADQHGARCPCRSATACSAAPPPSPSPPSPSAGPTPRWNSAPARASPSPACSTPTTT